MIIINSMQIIGYLPFKKVLKLIMEQTWTKILQRRRWVFTNFGLIKTLL